MRRGAFSQRRVSLESVAILAQAISGVNCYGLAVLVGMASVAAVLVAVLVELEAAAVPALTRKRLQVVGGEYLAAGRLSA